MIQELVTEFLKYNENPAILDLGPGYGDFALQQARQAKSNKISLLDYNEEVLNYQIKQFSKYNLVPAIYKSILDVEQLNSIEGKFDIILCQEILEHLINPEAILSALSSLLTINGKIIITVPTKFSEVLLKTINNNYMLNEPFGHIQLFNKKRLLSILKKSNLELVVFRKAQPHYFIAHLWLFGSRMKVEGATGKVLTNDWRTKVGNRLFSISYRFFHKTNISFWSNLFPRNYFLIASKV
jgi:2-polyprenyl-3-methyl-5-hydroxy-6-metoxy-1,4-benzoquinol methylase